MANKVFSSSHTTLEFTPWTDSGYRVTSLHVIEKLGGVIPKGEMSLFFADSSGNFPGDLVKSQNTGTIKLADEKEYPENLKYEFDVFITHRKFYGNYVDLEFVVTNNIDFYNKRISRYLYKSIPLKKKIEMLFPGKVDFRTTDPDVPDITVFQNCETNYEILTRLCYAYKKKSIFCYSWDGLIIKDLVGLRDHWGNSEPVKELDVYRLMQQSEPYDLNYDKLQNHDAFYPWATGEETTTQNDYTAYDSKYFTVQMDYQKYTVVEKEHDPYMMNTWLNTKMMNYPGHTTLKMVSTSMPHYKIGDALKNVGESKNISITIPWKIFVVYSNELYYSVDANNKLDENGFRYSWTSYFYGYEKYPFNEQA